MKKTRRKFGFTIVELLTVMAIIAILMGLLLPAMQAVRKAAKDVSQKAQFKSIETALEGYNSENGTYPESSVSSTSISLAAVGAHKLCEALVGRDLLGLDPKTTWEPETDEVTDVDIIYANLEAPHSSSKEKVEASLKRRQDSYLNSQDVEAFQVAQLFGSTGSVYPGNLDNTGGTVSGGHVSAPVMTDVYRSKKVILPNGTSAIAGTPILYYKADISSRDFPDTKETTGVTTDDLTSYAPALSAIDDYIYDVNDNQELVELNQMMKPAAQHNFAESHKEDVIVKGTAHNVNGLWLFYDTITNPKLTQPRPYNINSYILISAGNDGVYGTKDDIYNFEK